MNEHVNNLKETAFYAEAFSRNLGILSDVEQSTLRGKTVAIAGLGGVGGIYVASLCRLGVGGFHLSDKDDFELANFNRQYAATIESIGKPKTNTVETIAKSINPYIRLHSFTDGINEDSIDEFLSGVDLVIDAIDFFNIQSRRLLHAKAREKGLFILASVPLGYGAAFLSFDPDGMSFDQYFDISDDMSEEQKLIRFGIGFAPALLQRSYFSPSGVDFYRHKGPSLVTGTLVSATFVTSDAIRILLDKKGVMSIPRGMQFDPYARKFKKTFLPLGNRGPLQRIKRYIFEHWILNAEKNKKE